MPFLPITYTTLDARQKENYNFQKVSGVLADYGFSTIRLTADWQCADFIAQHLDGITFLRIQLKARPSFAKKYLHKDLWIAFPESRGAYLYHHDDVLAQVLATRPAIAETESWQQAGIYNFNRISPWLQEILRPHFLPAIPTVLTPPATSAS